MVVPPVVGGVVVVRERVREAVTKIRERIN